jgi:hypothetical protein
MPPTGSHTSFYERLSCAAEPLGDNVLRDPAGDAGAGDVDCVRATRTVNGWVGAPSFRCAVLFRALRSRAAEEVRHFCGFHPMPAQAFCKIMASAKRLRVHAQHAAVCRIAETQSSDPRNHMVQVEQVWPAE